ncbi:MAG: thermonuclease family protein [Alphaproteobacteria bacterium]|nr:thermonuclease family protein [Alphaproteobacteria bacterium]
MDSHERLSGIQIYWSDGDSGRIREMKFRLADVDAPETGSLNQRGGARCEAERELGYKAEEFMVEMTRDSKIEIICDYGTDRWDRHLIELAVNDTNIAYLALAAGHLRPGPHEGTRALSPKPDWCAKD